MFLELSEILVCPRCRPAQGLVVLGHRIEDRRVHSGALGCPSCEARFPVRRGEIRFDGSDDDGFEETNHESSPARSPDPSRDGGEETAVATAALLGVTEGEGYLLLGASLAPLAPRVSELTGGTEILALDAGPGEVRPGVSWARGVDPGALPVFSGRLRGVALSGEDLEATGHLGDRDAVSVLEEAFRSLQPGARLVLLRPGPAAEAARRVASRGNAEVAAADDRALVAVRRG